MTVHLVAGRWRRSAPWLVCAGEAGVITVLAMLALVGGVSIVLRVAMSRPPRRGLSGSVAGRPDSPALPARSVVVRDEFAPPQPVPVAPFIDRLEPLQPPDTSVAVLGVETSTDESDRRLWLVVRDKLTRG